MYIITIVFIESDGLYKTSITETLYLASCFMRVPTEIYNNRYGNFLANGLDSSAFV